MRILHCCLAAFYIDGYGYQENILPKMHKIQGFEVKIIASTETYLNNKNLEYVKPSTYLNEDGIFVTRIPYIKMFPKSLTKKLRIYSGLTNFLHDFKPDIIFLHDFQFLSIYDIVNYVNKNKSIKVFADSHTDYINSAKNWISMNVLHKIIYRHCAKMIEPYTKRFYGTLPIREIFLNEVYKLPAEKISLLELGADDSTFDLSKKNKIRGNIRKEMGFSQDDFIIITGGKIDKRKNIHILMQTISNLKRKKIKLLVFGTPDDNMEDEMKKYSNCTNIYLLGWLKPSKVYDFLFASDLAFFPGTHSVLWEQVVGIGMPAIFKMWENITHIDVGGNCIFLKEITNESISEVILKLMENPKIYKKMLKVGQEKGIKRFSYSEIAKRAIQV